jgi:hypothetical protein
MTTEAPTETPVTQICGPCDLIYWVRLGPWKGALEATETLPPADDDDDDDRDTGGTNPQAV